MTLLLQSPSFELWWESHRGAIRLQSPGRAFAGGMGVELVRQGRAMTLTTEKLSPGRIMQTTLEDAHGRAEEVHIHYQEVMGITLSFRIRLYATRPFVLIRLSLTNVGPEPVQIRRFFIHTPPEGFLPLEPPTGVYLNGWQSWSPAGFTAASSHGFAPISPIRWLQGPMIQNARTPWPERNGRFWSESVGAIVTPREALVLGGASLGDQFVQVYADVRPGHYEVMLQSQADDIPVETGGACNSEWFYVEWVPMPNTDPLAQYAHAVARQMEVPARKPAPTGWCSWYIYWNKVDEADMMENIASAALLADEVPLKLIQLDEGYQNIWGDWTERNERFPHTLKWLADRIRGSGFTPGLWLGPLTAHPQSRLATSHPDWLLRDARERPVSPGLISGFMARALDPTHPGVEEHLRSLIHTAVHEWGFPYLKLDFMYAGALEGRRYNSHLTRAQALRHALSIIREAAGNETYLVGCGLPLGPAVGMVDAMRIGADTAPQWGPSYGKIGQFLKRNPALPSLRNSLKNVATRAWTHNRWWTNDPDTLLVRNTQTALTADEVRAQVTLAGLSGGLTLLSDDLEALPQERRELVAALLPPLTEGMDVLDLFESAMPETVVAPVAHPWDRWRLVGLFNWSDAPVERTLPDSLTLNRQQAYHIVDFWERRYVRLEGGSFAPVLHLAPHGVALLGIRAVREAPQLVATTFHISQGAEISAWETSMDAVSLTVTLGRSAHGEVWLSLPARPIRVLVNDEALPESNVRRVAPGIWAIICHVNRAATLHVAWG